MIIKFISYNHYKMKFNELNDLLIIDDVINILSSLGIDIKSNQNFKLRDEKTPSCGIYLSNGKVKVKDFGNGFNGDIFDTLVEYFRMDKLEAKKYVMNYLGLSDDEVSYKPLPQRKSPIKTEVKQYLSQNEILAVWDRYIPLINLDKRKVVEVIDKLIPYEYFKTAPQNIKKDFLKVVRYDKYQDEPVVAIFAPSGEMLSIKHRRYKIKGKDKPIKWKALKDTTANKYTQIRITNHNEPVFIIEGTHDYITAILLNINFIALPTKTYKQFKSDELALLKGYKYDFIYLPDIDYKDKESYIKVKAEIEEMKTILKVVLKPFSKEYFFIWNLQTCKQFDYLDDIRQVKDLSDLCKVSDCYNIEHIKTMFLLAEYIDKINKGFNDENY